MVHPGVSSTEDGLLYSCVDVRAKGKLHDLNAYLRPADGGHEVAEILVHQLDAWDRLR